jgi:protein TonB
MRRLALIATLFFAIPLFADNASLEAQLRSEFVGQRFFISGFPSGVALNFDVNGNLIDNEKPGTWTVDGLVEIQKVTVFDDRVEFAGERKLISFEPTRHVKGTSPVPETRTHSGGKVVIRVARSSSDGKDSLQAVRRILLDRSAPILGRVPPYWKPFVCRMEAASNGASESMCDTFQIKGIGPLTNPEASGKSAKDKNALGVKPPEAKYTPDPVFPNKARRVRSVATCVFMVVIGEDGVPSNIRVTEPCGLGFDDSAYAAIQEWRFKPATRNKEPMPVTINIEINFQ